MNTLTINQSEQPSAPTRYLSIQRLLDKLSRKKTWLYDRMASDPTFPKFVRIGARRAFRESEIEQWINAQQK
jgi:predicted DNA-binding transcriptional regulator AlpA